MSIDSLHSQHPVLVQMLTSLLHLEPESRHPCAKVEALMAESAVLQVMLAKAPARRGDFSVVQGQLEDHILRWLQADPLWGEVAVPCGQAFVGMASEEADFKSEEGGFVGRSPPECMVCNTVDMSRPLKAKRVAAWVRCFLKRNECWLTQLTQEVRKRCASYPINT